MKNYDKSVEINHNPNWLYIHDHLYRILIIGGSGSGKTISLLNLLKNQLVIVSTNIMILKNLRIFLLN